MSFLGLRLPVLALFFLGFPLLWLLWLGVYAMRPGPLSSLEQIEVIVPANASLSAIEKILAENKVIHADSRFSMLAVLTGSAAKLRAGEYAFAPGKKPLDVIALLKKGEVLYRPVTIPEGTEMAKVAEILAEDGWVERERFLALAHDQEMLTKMGISAGSLEGYLFPDTYFLSRGQQNAAEIMAMMVAKHWQVYDTVVKHKDENTPALTHHEVVTLASIVEKETGNPGERPLIAAVFLNRLQKGMRLQADPTVRYGLEDKAGSLAQDDLRNPTPYNTYVIKGLPPGPITNPGQAAMEAVLFPAETEYLYFVSKDETSHHFSRTLQEHNRAVARYRGHK